MLDLTLPCPAEALIPHRLPMRLVERLIRVDGKNGVVEARAGATTLLTDSSGTLEEVALVEIMAQAYAALKGYLDRCDQLPVRRGFLVGIKEIVCYRPLQVDDLVQVHIRTVAELDDFAVAAGEIHCGDELIASGDVKVWIQ